MTWIPSTSAVCTGLAADWCPVHGHCTCPPEGDRERSLHDESCPLHSPYSSHAEEST